MEALRIALISLAVNRLRAVLTTLGIIIGVGSVIGLISLGRGVETLIADQFSSLGSNLLAVFSSPPNSPTRDRIEPLTSIEALELAELPTVAGVAPLHILNGNLVYESESVSNQISYGATPSYVELREYAPQLGRFIAQADVDEESRVLVLGWDVAEDLFGELDDGTINPVGATVRFLDTAFTVIGVMEETSNLTGDNGSIFIPISTSQQRLAPPDRSRTRDGGYYLDAIYLQAANKDETAATVQAIENYLFEAHEIRFDGEQDYTIINQSDLLDSLNSITANLTIFLALIASTSLLVGGIGIMNIMLVSVTERTREIGIRKAIGAKQADILLQFLIESVVLSLLGGFLGIALGVSFAFLGTALVDTLNLSVQMDSIILATGVSATIGIIFGLYPAWQAARKNPIDALRTE
jgi:putative ABC transport system permease protein